MNGCPSHSIAHVRMREEYLSAKQSRGSQDSGSNSKSTDAGWKLESAYHARGSICHQEHETIVPMKAADCSQQEKTSPPTSPPIGCRRPNE